jgi:hypothetical protein
MIIEFFLHANSECVIMSAPQVNMRVELKNIVAFTPTKNSVKTIVAYGLDSQDLQNKVPEKWAELKSSARFTRPFDVGQFDPDLAVSFLGYGTLLALANSGRPVIAVHIDRFDFKLEIKGYETLPLEAQQEFENNLHKTSLMRIRRLVINGRDMAKSHRQRALAAGAMKWMSLPWILLLIGVSLVVDPITTSVWFSKPLEGAKALMPMLVVLLRFVVACCAGVLLGTLSTLLVLRRFLPRVLLKAVLKSEPLGLPKPVTRWLADKFLGEVP